MQLQHAYAVYTKNYNYFIVHIRTINQQEKLIIVALYIQVIHRVEYCEHFLSFEFVLYFVFTFTEYLTILCVIKYRQEGSNKITLQNVSKYNAN